jgi:hypothetical protein
MLNQPKGMNPIGYLRNSARLLRRQWDDGLVEGMVIGNVDLTAAGYVIATGTLIVAALAGLASHQQMVTLWGVLLVFAMLCPFDADLFNRAWQVRGQAEHI